MSPTLSLYFVRVLLRQNVCCREVWGSSSTRMTSARVQLRMYKLFNAKNARHRDLLNWVIVSNDTRRAVNYSTYTFDYTNEFKREQSLVVFSRL